MISYVIIFMSAGDGTHSKKRSRHQGDDTHSKKLSKEFITEGMIPIAKNITVVDENGNEYEPTYLKRAKGLVKNGRARFLAEDKICLSRPPDKFMEDFLMSDNMNTNLKHIKEVAKEISKEQKAEAKVSMEYIMAKINQILEDKQHITDAIEALRNFENSTANDGGVGDAHKAEALANIVRHREQTNQKLLDILSKMLDHHIGLI